MKNRLFRGISVLLAAFIMLSGVGFVQAENGSNSSGASSALTEKISGTSEVTPSDVSGETKTVGGENKQAVSFSRFSYSEYQTLYGFSEDDEANKDNEFNAEFAGETVSVYGADHSAISDAADVMKYDEADTAEGFSTAKFPGETGKSIMTSESAWVEWTIDIPKTGLYSMNVLYYTLKTNGNNDNKGFDGKGSDVERSFYIDGEQPFTEAASLVFSRYWADSEEGFGTDIMGNDIRPESQEVCIWQNCDSHNASGFYNDPFRYYLTKGKHVIRFGSEREPMVLNRITFYTPEEYPTYAEYLEMHKGKEVKTGEGIRVQAENVTAKSSSTIYSTYDRASSGMQDHDGKLAESEHIKINMLSGTQFSTPYQWVKWTVNVPTEGLYKIDVKFKQDTRDGAFCNRTLRINDEIPCEEARYMQFDYNSSWDTKTLDSADGKEMYFYFKAGENTISLEVTLGTFSSIVSRVDEVVYDLNQCYRDIVMITGSSPDTFRDYSFRTLIPHTLENMETDYKELEKIKADIEALTGTTGSFTSIFTNLVLDIKTMVDHPSKIASKLSNFKTNLGSMSTWELNATSQAISLDWLQITPVDEETPDAGGGFMNNLWFQLKLFIASFYVDYDSVGALVDNSKNDADSVKVWIATGRDQFLTIRRLIDNNFSESSQAHYKNSDGEDTSVTVNLQLVAAGTLLPSVLAGTGPDVSLQSGGSDPVNYAIRNAVVDLHNFPRFDEVKTRFSPEAMVPYTYKEAVYALPETFTFNMLFYRTDILSELGLSIPQTWDDVYDCMVELNMNNMMFGVTASLQTYATLLYQNGGTFYKDERLGTDAEGRETALDSTLALKTFEQWTEFYTAYGTLVDFDFANRFRTGEMPLGIADYSMYNQLSVFATEIKGLWEFAPLPGIEKVNQKTGETYIDRKTTAAGTGCIMLSSSKKKESSWQFMDWWTSTDIQVKYGRELESMQGVAGRYATANVEAMAQLPWDTQDYTHLMEQWNETIGIPEYPGSYILGRYVDFAFRDVVNTDVEPGETLKNYIEDINEELKRKRAEFED